MSDHLVRKVSLLDLRDRTAEGDMEKKALREVLMADQQKHTR